MKIGIYDPYLDDLGGGEKYMMTIASCLAKEHDISVFWDNKNDIQIVSERFSIDLYKTTIEKNLFSPAISSFERVIKTRKYDAIIILSDGSIPLVGAKKLFVHIQQPLQHMQTRSLFEKLKLSRVNAFFCNSSYTKSYIERKFGISLQVIFPPVALHVEKMPKINTILHVGRFRSVHGADYKKQSVMVQAFKDMVDKGLKNWKFVLAASVHEEDMDTFGKMEKSAKGYPISFLINKTNKELWEAYSKAKIYWHASGFGEDLEKHPELAEHFGISTVEAMGAGTVPVVINAGGQKEIVIDGQNGLLWNTLKELEQKTLQLTKDTKLWKKLSENAKKTAEQFSEERFCKEIRELLHC